VAVYVRGLENLDALLVKADAYAQNEQLDPAIFIEARLAPDMFTLARQVQAACDAAKMGASRLADVERPAFPDTEVTFSELCARIGKTLAYVQGIEPEQFDGSADRVLTVNTGNGKIEMTGQAYLLKFSLPNFFFHVAMAYGILRHEGLNIGKSDYLGAF
jgi:hypothetical protein